MQLVTGTGVALHVQVREYLLEQIRAGMLSEGDQLPPEISIAGGLQVSRSTVRQAVLSLVSEGLLTRRAGKGTFVTRPKVQADLQAYLALRPDLGAGEALVHRTLRQTAEPAHAAAAAALAIAPGTEVVTIERVRIIRDRPVCLEYFYVPRHLCPELASIDAASQTISNVLRSRFGIRIASCATRLEAISLTRAEAGLLRTRRGHPALQIEKVFRDPGGLPVLYSRNLASDCQYHVNMEGPDERA